MSRLVPDLRFKEFTGEWEENTLEGIAKFINEKISLNKISLDNYISTENLLADFEGISKSSKLPNITNVTKFQKHDVLMSNIRPYLKKIWLANIDGGASNDIIVTRVKEDNNYKFLLYIVQNDKFIDYVMQGAKGVKMPRGDIALIKKYPLALPKPKEQQKIANCLNSLDILMEAQNKKVEALKKHKKGLMQQLFPQEDAKVPACRFEGFIGEWEEKTIGNVSQIKGRIGYRGYTVDDIVAKGEGAITLSPSNFIDNKINIFKSTYISWYKYNESPEIKIKNGDILFVKTGSTYGKTAFVKDLSEKATINPQIVVLKDISINNQFLNYIVMHTSIKKQIEEIVVGGAIPTMSQKQLAKMKFLLPKKDEQEKIVHCLTSLDNLIEAGNKKIKALKEHKKGLMQQLFVSSED